MKGECLCDDCDYETCLCSQCDSSDDCKDGDACNYSPEKPKRENVEEKINDGGSAFPVLDNYATEQGGYLVCRDFGMTMRDYFAGQALAGITADMKGDPVLSEWARLAYKFADAMLAEREKRNGKDSNCD